ncbi:P1 family peptidase [Euzebya tangerina]|uniref:P1 family peptidase n=1 Tax=Euzebya tangerina TaxID=591198 RepID=UPI000E316980|nr:P1 family peptidase [Euzebya tangerina]
MALGLDDVLVGHWTHPGGHTGCSVVLPPAGSIGACSVRGGAPGTREAAALGPGGQGTECHGIFLSGGSAFGLAVGDGVAHWCEEQGRGYDRFVTPVPVIGGAIVFDLREAGAGRPDAAAGRAACAAATTSDPAMGRVGVGAGCTVSKIAGFEHLQPGGQGWAVATGGGITVGALMAVNALGNVLAEDGSLLTGVDTREAYPYRDMTPPPQTNTVIGCLVTDAVLTKAEAVRAVDLAHTGIARSVDPPHTTMDGDALFLLSTKRTTVTAPIDLVATLGAQAVAAAIRASVRAAAA